MIQQLKHIHVNIFFPNIQDIVDYFTLKLLENGLSFQTNRTKPNGFNCTHAQSILDLTGCWNICGSIYLAPLTLMCTYYSDSCNE